MIPGNIPVTVIPDVHGRTFWKEAARGAESRHLLFLGDYLDPYPKGFHGPPEFSPEEVIGNFREILGLKKSAPDRVTLLLGNHDCQYLYGRNVCDCRCDYPNYDLIRRLFRENGDCFQIAAESQRGGKHFVFVHAGIHDGWMDRHVEGWTPENMVTRLNRMNASALRDGNPERTRFAAALAERDFLRGGEHGWGSPVWVDAVTMDEAPRIDGVVQVVGHTAVRFADEAVVTEKVVFADCKRVVIIGPRGGLRYPDGRKCRNKEKDPFHPTASKYEKDKPFGIDWFNRPFCRRCGSHYIRIRGGMFADHWHCMDCGNNSLSTSDSPTI